MTAMDLLGRGGEAREVLGKKGVEAAQWRSSCVGKAKHSFRLLRASQSYWSAAGDLASRGELRLE